MRYNGVLHQQFFDIVLVKVISQHSYAVELEEQAHHVLDDSNDSRDDDEDDMGLRIIICLQNNYVVCCQN